MIFRGIIHRRGLALWNINIVLTNIQLMAFFYNSYQGWRYTWAIRFATVSEPCHGAIRIAFWVIQFVFIGRVETVSKPYRLWGEICQGVHSLFNSNNHQQQVISYHIIATYYTSPCITLSTSFPLPLSMDGATGSTRDATLNSLIEDCDWEGGGVTILWG